MGKLTRRSFLIGIGASLAAPAIITTPGLLMPVRSILLQPDWKGEFWKGEAKVGLWVQTAGTFDFIISDGDEWQSGNNHSFARMMEVAEGWRVTPYPVRAALEAPDARP